MTTARPLLGAMALSTLAIFGSAGFAIFKIVEFVVG
jgi:hypothetical protein